MRSQDSFINIFLQHPLRAKGWLSTEDLAVDRQTCFCLSLKPGAKAGSADLTSGPLTKGREDSSSHGMCHL